MDPKSKNALVSAAFYFIAIIAIIVFNVSDEFKSGPCTPNFDIFSVFLLGPLSAILLIKNGIQTFLLKRETSYSFRIHLIALLIWVIVLFAL